MARVQKARKLFKQLRYKKYIKDITTIQSLYRSKIANRVSKLLRGRNFKVFKSISKIIMKSKF